MFFPKKKTREYDDKGSENHSNHTEQFRNSLNIIKEHSNTFTISSIVNKNCLIFSNSIYSRKREDKGNGYQHLYVFFNF
uniref:Uncharacterized protein n=1 Tax=Glossina morsitans morsitans TaxID=37546 RepID=A0ABK9NGQ4_GLOMM